MGADAQVPAGDVEPLLEYLRQQRGFDFTGYKRPSLGRRIARRMQEVQIDGYDAYIDFLEVHPEEFESLFNTILINVTAFFRDAPAWQCVAEELIPQILARKGDGAVRVWSAACASGEEAYTLAMLFCEAMGEASFRERVKIYATDVDEPALAQARRASYAKAQLAAVPGALLEKYFEPGDRDGDGQAFRHEMRRSVIFGRHDLVQDAPISRIDLLACRNALMYFNAETQARVLARFHYALDDGGYLLLGKAETILSRHHFFEPVNLKLGVFAKAAGPSAVAQLLDPRRASDGGGAGAAVGEAAFDAVAAALLVVDASGHLVLANLSARELFGLEPADLGRPFQDLEASFRPVELRSTIEEAITRGRPVNVGRVDWPAAGNDDSPRIFEVVLTPLVDPSGAAVGTTITFTDVSHHLQLEEQLHTVHRDLETAYEDLQSTNEELETTNEELQSTVEEIETTNEELQATNEELETMNEELQSGNEELQTMNEELRERTSELNRANALLDGVFASMGRAIVVVARDLTVTAWNRQCEDLWGLRRDEAEGSNLTALEFGLPLDDVGPQIQACLDGSQADDVVVRGVNRRGKDITCIVHCTAIRRADVVDSVVLTIEVAP